MAGCESSVLQAEISSVVLNTFNQEFEDTKQIGWEMKKNLFMAEFEFQKKDLEVMIDENLDISEELKETLAKGFSDNKIDDVHLVVNRDTQYYQVEFE